MNVCAVKCCYRTKFWTQKSFTVGTFYDLGPCLALFENISLKIVTIFNLKKTTETKTVLIPGFSSKKSLRMNINILEFLFE